MPPETTTSPKNPLDQYLGSQSNPEMFAPPPPSSVSASNPLDNFLGAPNIKPPSSNPLDQHLTGALSQSAGASPAPAQEGATPEGTGIWGWLNRPLVTLPKPSEDFVAQHPYISAVTRGAESMAEGLTTPLSIGLILATGGLGAAAEGGLAAAEGGTEAAEALAGVARGSGGLLSKLTGGVAGKITGAEITGGANAFEKLAAARGPQFAEKTFQMAKWAARAANLGFTGQMIYGVSQQVPEIQDRLAVLADEKATPQQKEQASTEALQLATEAVMGSTMAVLGAKHLAGEIRGRANTGGPTIEQWQRVQAAHDQPAQVYANRARSFESTNRALIQNPAMDMAARLWHNAGEDNAKLEEWRKIVADDKAIRPQIREKWDGLLQQAQTLPDNVKELSRSLRDPYNTMYDRLVEMGKLPAEVTDPETGEKRFPKRENYAGQMEYVPGDEHASDLKPSGIRSTKSPGFTKKAYFDDPIEALQNGYEMKDGLAAAHGTYLRRFGSLEGVMAAEKQMLSLKNADGTPFAVAPGSTRVVNGKVTVALPKGFDVTQATYTPTGEPKFGPAVTGEPEAVARRSTSPAEQAVKKHFDFAEEITPENLAKARWIMPNGDVILGDKDILHGDIAGTVSSPGVYEGSTYENFSKDTGGAVRIYAGPSGVTLAEAYSRPSGGQIRRVAEAAKASGKSVRWDLYTGKVLKSGAGSVGEFMRAIDETYPETDAMSRRAEKSADESGGFTIHPTQGTPKSGYSVEVYPEARRVLDHTPTAEDIQKFRLDNKDLLDKHSDLHIGASGNTLKISAVTPDRGAAVNVARSLDQKSVANLERIPTEGRPAKGAFVGVGGKGEKTQFPEYPLEQRLSDLNRKVNPEGLARRAQDTVATRAGSVASTVSNPAETGGLMTLDLNHAGKEVVSDLLGTDRDWDGKNFTTRKVATAADALENMAVTKNSPQLQALAQQMRAAAEHNGDAGVLMRQTGLSPERAQQALDEELWHAGQRAAGGGRFTVHTQDVLDAVRDNPLEQKGSQTLQQSGYPDNAHVIALEIEAKILAGDHASVGLTPEESQQLLFDHWQALMKAHPDGIQSPNEHAQRYAAAMKKVADAHAERIKQIESTQNQLPRPAASRPVEQLPQPGEAGNVSGRGAPADQGIGAAASRSARPDEGVAIRGYHGTESEFTGAPRTDGLGAHFSVDRDVAGRHTLEMGKSARVIEANLNINKPLRIEDTGFSHSSAPNTIESLVKQNVLPKTFEDGLSERLLARQAELIRSGSERGSAWDQANNEELAKVKQYLQKQGYDGLVYKNTVEGGGDSYVAFDPSQISIPDSRRQTETPEFKRWFGGSKAVDEDGNPQRVYHGTSQDFNVFDKEKQDLFRRFTGRPGFFFTSNPEQAGISAEWANVYRPGAENIIPAYVKMENPYVRSAGDRPAQKWFDSNWRAVTEQAKRSGADGIIVKDNAGNKMYVAFEPNQIKSAIGNRGTFDPNNPDMLARRTPPESPANGQPEKKNPRILADEKGNLRLDVSDYKPGPDLFNRLKFRANDENGKPLYDRQNILVHPDNLKDVNRSFADTSWFRQNPIMSGLLNVSGQAKRSLLSFFSPFHFNTEFLRGIQMGASVKEALHPGPLTEDRLVFNTKFAPKIVDPSSKSLYAEGVAQNTPLVHRIKWVGPAMKVFEDKLFGDYIPRLKADSFDRVVKQLGDRNPNWTQDQVHFAASKIVDAAFGGINWKQLGVSMNSQDLARLVMLAPDFTGSQALFAKYGLDPGSGSVVRQSLGRIAMYNFGVARVLNLLTTQKLHLEHPFGVVSPDNKKVWSIRTMPEDIMHGLTDPRGFIANRLNPLIGRTGMETLTGRDNRGKAVDAHGQLMDLLKNVTPIGAQNFVPAFKRPGETVFEGIGRAAGLNAQPNMTVAQKKAAELASNHAESGPVDPAQLDHHQTIMQLEDAIRSKQVPFSALNAAYVAGNISKLDARAIQTNIKETAGMDDQTARLYTRAARLPFPEFLNQIWSVATPPEKTALIPLLAKKKAAYMKEAMVKMTPQQRMNDPTIKKVMQMQPNQAVF